MDLVWSIALLLCGVLAASALIVKKQPNAKELIDKLVPIQGYLGIAVLLCGVWALIQILMNLSAFHIIPMHMVCWLLMALVMIGLGFLLGYGLINQFALNKKAGAPADGSQPAPEASPAAIKAAALQAKLTTYQIPLGLAGIALGLWGLIGHFVI